MNPFDTAALLIAIAAGAGYLNHQVLKLPATSGTLIVALGSSIVVVVADAAVPTLQLRAALSTFLERIDFNETLMHGMLSFLLFAGALHVEIEGLLEHKWTIAVLATIGVLISTLMIGTLSWWMFGLLGVDVPLMVCFVFGALISPTDPVAVMGLLKELRAPASLEAQIAGESLFNDGIGVVVFLALVSMAGLAGVSEAEHLTIDPTSIATFFLREVVGGLALGWVLGYVTYRGLKSLDDHPLELLMTLALAMFAYAISFRLHVSGPIAVVTAGLFIGNQGRRFAMSERTREHVDAFWGMVDEILNAVLFLLIGLLVFTVPERLSALTAAAFMIPTTLLARFISVALPVAAMNVRGRLRHGIVAILTWSGLRGGISVAMVLSLPRFPAKEMLLACTYGVVVFSILVQGLTMRRVLLRYGVGERGK